MSSSDAMDSPNRSPRCASTKPITSATATPIIPIIIDDTPKIRLPKDHGNSADFSTKPQRSPKQPSKKASLAEKSPISQGKGPSVPSSATGKINSNRQPSIQPIITADATLVSTDPLTIRTGHPVFASSRRSTLLPNPRSSLLQETPTPKSRSYPIFSPKPDKKPVKLSKDPAIFDPFSSEGSSLAHNRHDVEERLAYLARDTSSNSLTPRTTHSESGRPSSLESLPDTFAFTAKERKELYSEPLQRKTRDIRRPKTDLDASKAMSTRPKLQPSTTKHTLQAKTKARSQQHLIGKKFSMSDAADGPLNVPSRPSKQQAPVGSTAESRSTQDHQ